MRWVRRGWLLAAVANVTLACSSSAAFGSSAERAVEMVSPPYKGGFPASHIEAVSEDGDSLAFFSPGVFDGAPSGLSGGLNDDPSYLARRGGAGWSTVPFLPPAEAMPSPSSRDVAPTLDATIAAGYQAGNAEGGNIEGLSWNVLMHESVTADTPENWSLAGLTVEALEKLHPEVAYQGSDTRFCHMFLQNIKSEEVPLTFKESHATEQIYEINRGCDGEMAGMRLLGVDNGGGEGNIISNACPVSLGNGPDHPIKETFNAISANGHEVFFETCVNDNAAERQLFMRLQGSRTVEVSKPLTETCAEEIPCPEAASRPSAEFAGASEDGSTVLFVSSASLTGNTADTSPNLFMASIGCPEAEAACPVGRRVVRSITQVSHDPNTAGKAGVVGVIRVAPDGSRVYFVAKGNLLDEGEQQALIQEKRTIPQVGADNLYVYSALSPGKVAFIADLCTGYEVSGSAPDSQCLASGTPQELDEALWDGVTAEAQTAGSDGRFLVFSSYGQLTSDDTDAARDIYRYDATTGGLVRVSTGERGADSDGNDNRYPATMASGSRFIESVRDQYEMGSRAISEDGSRVVFTSAAPLSLQASNGLSNVYEWHSNGADEGQVSLVSSGTAETPTEDTVISPDGNNIFFVTTQGLVPKDTDGEQDVYDARIGGGFAETAVAPAECEGEECRGLLSTPASQLVPGSAVQAAGENLPPPPKPRPKHKKVRTGHRKTRGKHGKSSHRTLRTGSSSGRRRGVSR